MLPTKQQTSLTHQQMTLVNVKNTAANTKGASGRSPPVALSVGRFSPQLSSGLCQSYIPV